MIENNNAKTIQEKTVMVNPENLIISEKLIATNQEKMALVNPENLIIAENLIATNQEKTGLVNPENLTISENDSAKTIAKPKISIITLGCKVNQYDTDAMLRVVANGGFDICEGLEFADIYIINTCAVTAEAERKSRQTVGRILKINENAKIYVCGCASQNNFSQFEKENVEYISGTDGKILLAKEIVERYKKQCKDFGQLDECDCIASEKTEIIDKFAAPEFFISDNYEDNQGVISLRTRHYIKVQDGCNNFCNYCIVPYLRGRSRSRSLASILHELDSVKGHSKEVVVTGINLSAYGRDISSSLTELLRSLQSFDFRIRLGSLEVGVITREFLDATVSLKHFCPHFHLSLQSGDDTVLSDMNRKYSTKEYFEAVELIRKYYPNAGVTTDIIVGFPTETEQTFANSMSFASQVGFSDIHVFSYSARKGTVSSRMKVLEPTIVADRQKRMSGLKHLLSTNFLESQLGHAQEILFETYEGGEWCGHTPNYVKVYSATGERNTIQVATPTAMHLDGIRV